MNEKILFISAFPPNRQTAGQNYSRNLINDLVEVFDVDVVFFKYNDHKAELDKDVKSIKEFNLTKFSKLANCIKAPFLHPFFAVRFRISFLIFLLRNIKKYDLIYFDFSQMFFYSLFVRRKFKIFMCHDVIYQKYDRRSALIDKLFGRFLFFWEKKLLSTASQIYTFSEKDNLLIKKYYGLKADRVDFYVDKAISNIAYSNENVEFDKVFIFYGAWNRKENSEGLTWFINNVYPYVNKFDLRFKVIGGGMPVEIINKLKSLKHIEYSGFVDNPYKFLTSSSALLAPLFNGAGVKVKVIEALLTGTPVIGTVVALEGLDLLRGRSDFLYKCTSAKDFINAIDNFKKKSTEERQNFKSELNYPKNKAIDLIKKFRHAND